MDRDAFLDGLAEVLEQDRASLTDDAVLATLNWDSLAFVSFIAMADSRFEVRVSPKDLAECHTVGELAALIGSLVDSASPR